MYIDINNLDIEQMSLDYNISQKYIISSICKCKLVYCSKKCINNNKEINLKKIELSIFGDNILECERMVELIEKAFPELIDKTQNLKYIYSPSKILFNKEKMLTIQLYPDYKSSDRWGEKSILNLLGEHGANLTEAPDVVLTKSEDNIETILLAIEFSSAIPAGNQAWQRSGRALSFSEVQIPYLYITDIGLEELNAERESKAVRSSNPLVPLSYIKHSQRSSTFTYMVLNPSFLLEHSEMTKKFIVKNEVIHIVRGLILNNDISAYESQLEKKIAHYLNSYENIPESINFEDWIQQDDNKIESFIESFKLPKYNKKIASKTPIKPEMKTFIKDIVPDYALNIYNDLPICMVPSKNRKSLKENFKNKCYSSLPSDVYDWIEKDGPLVICFVNGFKPKGDDARPDRGLLPLARMLFGKDIDIMAIVFGQAHADMQEIFASSPIELAGRNGLWKSILYYSSLTIADSANWSLSNAQISKFRLTNEATAQLNENGISFPTPSKEPIKFKENDIDTAIHMTFASHTNIFESLCNPPGGDWSGISFLDKNGIEHRWMSLPRVSKDSKRPDHIFQISNNSKTIILIIESKEKLTGLLRDKANLGKALIDYVKALIGFRSSAIKTDGSWEKNTSTTFDLKIDKYITAAAFFFNNENDIEKAKNELKVDFIIAFNLKDHQLYYKAITEIGVAAISLLEN